MATRAFSQAHFSSLRELSAGMSPLFFEILTTTGGNALSGHVIEGITAEHTFLPEVRNDDRIFQAVSLQRACTVGDQHFSSYAILNLPDNKAIRTSRLREDSNKDLFR